MIVFPTESPEAPILKTIDNKLVSKWISVLRTDDPRKSLLFRKLGRKG